MDSNYPLSGTENSLKNKILLCFDHIYWVLRRPSKLRIVVIGADDSGKTSLIRRFAGDVFYEEKMDPPDNVFKLTTLLQLRGNKMRRYKTEIVEVTRKDLLNDENSDIHEKATGYLLVYDANSPYSFQKLSVFISQLRKRKRKLPPIVVIGNKSEICTTMSQVNNNIEIREDVESVGIPYFSTSAQQNSGIVEAFDDIIERCAEKKEWAITSCSIRCSSRKRDNLLAEDNEE